MMFLVTLFTSFQFMSTVTSVQFGTLAFLKAGTNSSEMNILENQSLTDTTNPFRHQLPLRKLLNDTYFRSPLIDQWDDLEVIRATITFYNSEKEYMGHYLFEADNPGEMDVDFVNTENVVSNNRLIVETGLHYGPELYIHQSGDEAFFAFMLINIANNITSMSGNQFILSAAGDYNFLAATEHYGCYSMPVRDDYIIVGNVFECTYYCLTVPECTYYGIFSKKNSSSHQVEQVCVPSHALPAAHSQECNSYCQDDERCGREYVDDIPLMATVNIYSMDPWVSEQLVDMQSSTLPYVNEKFEISTDSSVDLGDQVYIGGIRMAGNGSYMYNLLLYHDSCESMFDFDVQNDERKYHGYHSGHIKTFHAGNLSTFAPVRARCLFFNSSQSMEYRFVKIRMVTNKFVLAEYLTLQVEWNKAECKELEVMSRKDIVPDSAIDIVQFQSDIYFSNGSTYPVPALSYAVVHIHLDYDESWIEKLSILASVEVNVKIDVRTERDCTDRSSMKQKYMSLRGTSTRTASANTLTTERFVLLKSSGFPAFCGENVTVVVSALDPTVDFNFALQLYGCLLDSSQTFANCYMKNVLDTYDATAEGRLEPIHVLAFDAFRPGGGGLLLSDLINNDINITIRLSYNIDIPVRSVIISGSIYAASVDVGGQIVSGSAYMSFPNLQIEFTSAKGKHVHIFNIQRHLGSDLRNISVEIYACVIEYGNQTAPTNVTNVQQNGTTTAASRESTEVNGSGDGTVAVTNVGPVTTVSKQPGGNFNTQTTPDDNKATQTTPDDNIGTQTTPDGHTLTQTTPDDNIGTQTTPDDNIGTQTTPDGNAVTQTTRDDNKATQTTPDDNLVTQTTPDGNTVSRANQVTPTTKPQNRNERTTAPTPSKKCLCVNQTKNITSEELDILVKEIVQNLTVPASETSAYKRSKMSMPDERKSSAVIGAVGITSMVTIFGAVIAMDAAHILTAVNFVKSLLRKS